MKNAKNFDLNLFEKIFDLNSKNKIGANGKWSTFLTVCKYSFFN